MERFAGSPVRPPSPVMRFEDEPTLSADNTSAAMLLNTSVPLTAAEPSIVFRDGFAVLRRIADRHGRARGLAAHAIRCGR